MTRGIPPELLGLRELFQLRDPAPEHAVAAAYAARELVADADAAGLERLVLVGDSAEETEPVPLRARSGGRAARTLTFAVPGRIIELDLVPTVPGMFRAKGIVLSRAGRAAPAGTVVLRHPTGKVTGEVDPGGGVAIENVPAGPVSVIFRRERRAPVVSDWLVC